MIKARVKLAEWSTADRSWMRWNDGCVPKLLMGILETNDCSTMPMLADALEDAGYLDREVTKHLRLPHDCIHQLIHCLTLRNLAAACGAWGHWPVDPFPFRLQDRP